jgi:hypothetical protein
VTPDRVLIAANGRDAQRWQRQKPRFWTRVVAVSHPHELRGVDVDRVDVTPMAADHRDVSEALDLARWQLTRTTGSDGAIHYLPRT